MSFYGVTDDKAARASKACLLKPEPAADCHEAAFGLAGENGAAWQEYKFASAGCWTTAA